MRRPLWRALGVVALMLLALNTTVRVCGGNPFWLSPFFLGEKLTAIGKLALHAVPHSRGSCRVEAEKLVRQAARRHGVPASFALSVARTESGLQHHQISRAGAMGVMQLMPATARDLGVSDPFDPAQSVDGGVRYLKRLWRRYRGDRRRIAAAYNAGPGNIPRRGPLRLGGETAAYVRRVNR